MTDKSWSFFRGCQNDKSCQTASALHGFWRCTNRVLGGEANFHFQATALAIAGANAAAMDDGYSLRDREAQAGSASLMLLRLGNAVEGLKNVAEIFRRHPVTTVFDENSR